MGKELLIVPKDAEIRKQMRDSIKNVAQTENILPPASISKLEEMATSLINTLNLPAEYLNFAMVLAGNEIWRETIEATPFNRRLLLLPQCLRNVDDCNGEFDELGLICAACGLCNLDSILVKAESLGYNTLIAEGTTTAVGLVEEGAVDAVIGVSCMHVLERSFRKVSNVAVPVMGIPLLFDGCRNTQIDYQWLMDEIGVFNQNEAEKPISISLLKADIEDFFTDENTQPYFQGKWQTDLIAHNYLLSGGGRMRPLLSVLGYVSYATQVDNQTLLVLSLLTECFHKASLVHDDIADDEKERYGTTLHEKYNIPTAINVGDYLVGKGYELLSKLNIDPEKTTRCLYVITQSHIKLSRGQGDDIGFGGNLNALNINKVLEVYRLKTGEAIKTALLMGAIIGDANEEDTDILDQFSEMMGIAYQVKDDLDEFREHDENKKILDFPLLIALLNDYGPKQGIPEDIGEFEKLIEQFNLVGKAEDLLNQTLEGMYSLLDTLQNRKMRLSLYGVTGKIFKDMSND